MFERAEKQRVKPKAKVTLRGKVLNVDDPTPLAIARALRKNRQEKLDAKRREAKRAGR
ncbi:hypothetical protein LPJ38_26490 [Bradyrhizobium daqingense]|uniref:Uncharacterized protein n=1 Tax=Bradyrhizobium daqingense TaxID=993502 RepID=A0A562LMQ4_9BRAD|nr:hypothetical protein [Bradyrhizobium daqingense]TWI08910.1 hypothetical protein IQ17_01735 [Bradyrhizobium daqingense]UFS87180.1 hypothetical protein LPJ38_26490 [Bradyrhizobium daqingense]